MIRNILISLLIASSAVPAWAGKQDAEWRNPEKNQENREARRANFFAFESESLARAVFLLPLYGGHVALPFREEPSGCPTGILRDRF